MDSPNINPISESSTPANLPSQTLPAPRWTPATQKTFLEALARCGSVKASAAYAGMSRESAYRLRRRSDGRAFVRAWDAALIHARDLFADEMLDKGLNGWTETVWHIATIIIAVVALGYTTAAIWPERLDYAIISTGVAFSLVALAIGVAVKAKLPSRTFPVIPLFGLVVILGLAGVLV